MNISHHPYFPLRGWIKYAVFQFEGIYHAPSKQLSIVSQTTPPLNAVQIWKQVRLPSPFPVVATVTTLPGQPEPTPDNMEALYPHYIQNGRWRSSDGTQDWFGEANTLFPFQPILTTNPVVGEQFRVTSDNHGFNAAGVTDPTGKFTVDYKTMYHGPWAGWPDCWMTAMVENPQLPEVVCPYNYVFARGIGRVDLWQGVLDESTWTYDANGTPLTCKTLPGRGYRWYATEWEV